MLHIKMYIAEKAKHSLSLWVINWQTGQMLHQHPHLSEQMLHMTNRDSIFVLTRTVAWEPLKNTQTHMSTKNMGNKSLHKSDSVLYVSGIAENY